jgi:hypothetical protein
MLVCFQINNPPTISVNLSAISFIWLFNEAQLLLQINLFIFLIMLMLTIWVLLNLILN